MMKSLICAGFLTFFCVTAGAAETWQYEGAVVYSSSKQKSAPNVDTSAIGAGVGYSFSPLPTVSNYPLAEAQFAERVGNAQFLYLNGNAETDTLEKTDVNVVGTSVTLMQPSSDFALQVGFNRPYYSDAKIKNSSSQVKINEDTISVAAGYFVQKYLLIAIEHKKDSATYLYQPTSIPSIDSDTTTNRLFVQYLANLNDVSFFAGNLSAGVVNATTTGNAKKSNRIASFRGTYYLNKMHGVSLEYGQNSGDDLTQEGRWYQVGYQGFITNSVSINGAYKKFSIKDSSQGSDETTVMAGMSVRF